MYRRGGDATRGAAHEAAGLGDARPDNGSGADRLVLAVITPSGAGLYSTAWVIDRDWAILTG
jgi:hypothetical protein